MNKEHKTGTLHMATRVTIDTQQRTEGSIIDINIKLQQSALPQLRQQGRTKPAQAGGGNRAEVSNK